VALAFPPKRFGPEDTAEEPPAEMVPLYAGLFVTWKSVERALRQFLENLRDHYEKGNEISALVPVRSPHVTTWYFGGSWTRLNALGGRVLLDHVTKQEGTEMGFQIHHFVFATAGLIVAEVRGLDTSVEREPDGPPHLTLMTGADLKPRDAGEVILAAAQLGLLDEQDIGPGEMFHVPEARVGSLQTSLVVLRLQEPLVLRAVYRTVNVEEPALEPPSLLEPEDGPAGVPPAGLPPPRPRPVGHTTYSRDELVRQRPIFTTMLPEFASLKSRSSTSSHFCSDA
jgi:hypothetical protein